MFLFTISKQIEENKKIKEKITKQAKLLNNSKKENKFK